MPQIQVFEFKTTILDYLSQQMEFDSSSDWYCLKKLNEISAELTKSLNTRGRTAQIRWDVSDDSDSFIQDFANKQNIINKF